MARIKFYENNSEYFRWLLDIIGDNFEGKSYMLLLKHLYSTDYTEEHYMMVPNDSNRYFDAIELRKEGCKCRYGDTVNLLEVMIAIAHHMDDNAYDMVLGEQPNKWFWELIENIELDEYDDEEYNKRNVDHICDTLLYRTYNFDGKGGLFPLKNPGFDQRKVELWYQMETYLLDNYEY